MCMVPAMVEELQKRTLTIINQKLKAGNLEKEQRLLNISPQRLPVKKVLRRFRFRRCEEQLQTLPDPQWRHLCNAASVPLNAGRRLSLQEIAATKTHKTTQPPKPIKNVNGGGYLITANGAEEMANGRYVPCPKPINSNDRAARVRPYPTPMTTLTSCRLRPPITNCSYVPLFFVCP